MTDQQLIDLTIRTNLSLIKSINRNTETDGLIFHKKLLARGIETLEKKTGLTPLEQSNLMRFNNNWSMEVNNVA